MIITQVQPNCKYCFWVISGFFKYFFEFIIVFHRFSIIFTLFHIGLTNQTYYYII